MERGVEPRFPWEGPSFAQEIHHPLQAGTKRRLRPPVNGRGPSLRAFRLRPPRSLRPARPARLRLRWTGPAASSRSPLRSDAGGIGNTIKLTSSAAAPFQVLEN